MRVRIEFEVNRAKGEIDGFVSIEIGYHQSVVTLYIHREERSCPISNRNPNQFHFKIQLLSRFGRLKPVRPV
jgi:hypothetical protein